MEQKKRILIVHNYYQVPGGEDTVVANEKKLLEEHQHEVTLYNRNNSEIKAFSKIQKLLFPLVTIFNPRTYREVNQIIREKHIDIVHVHNTLSLISHSVYYAAFNNKVPVVQTIHNFRLLCPGASFYRDGHICEDCVKQGLKCAIKHSCYRGSKAQTFLCVLMTLIYRIIGAYGKINYICLTEFNKAKILQLNKLGKKPVIGINRIYIKPNFTYERTKRTNAEYYLFVGRIEKLKGVNILLQAFSNLPNCLLRIAGIGTDLNTYKEVASDMKNIEFLGFLNPNEINETIAHAKAVIVPSQWFETFGMIIIEAYSGKVPVIVGNIGNIGSLVDEGVTGLKFIYDSAESLTDAVSKFELGCGYEWGKNAYLKYKAEFSPETNYEMLMRIYDSVTDSGEQ